MKYLSLILSACKIIVPSLLLPYFSFFISLGILRSTWEFLEHNLGNSRKVEWQHCLFTLTRMLQMAEKVGWPKVKDQYELLDVIGLC